MDTAGFSIGTTRYGGNRHPFRATLPRRVLRTLPEPEPEVAERLSRQAAREAAVADAPARRRRGISLQDVKDFLLAYCACLVAVLAYLG